MPRGAVVILQDGKIALIERNVIGETPYFLFPGGQVETGEDIENAAIREAYEELGVKVRLGSLAAVVEFANPKKRDRTQYYYWAEIVGGQFGTGDGTELNFPLESKKGTYQPVWMPLEKLPELDVRPKDLSEALYSGTASNKKTLKIKE